MSDNSKNIERWKEIKKSGMGVMKFTNQGQGNLVVNSDSKVIFEADLKGSWVIAENEVFKIAHG